MAGFNPIAAAGAPAFLTPAMIAAAVRVIADEYGVCSEYVAEGLVQDIFKAMIAAQSNQAASDAKEPPRVT